jgi:mRNA-degrading endonuclease RelE of RelBE toxin-antitoxin system
MPYTVEILRKAKKDIRKLDSVSQVRVNRAINLLGQTLPDRPTNWSPMGPNTKPFQDYGANGKLTVGKYRVLTIINDDNDHVDIPRVFKRGDSEYGFSEGIDEEADQVTVEDCGKDHGDSDDTYEYERHWSQTKTKKKDEDEPPVEEDTRKVMRRIIKGTK